MTKFIKLSSLLINLADVSHIHRTDTKKYIITMRSQAFNGFIFLGNGFLHSPNHKITVCEKEHTDCYKIMDKWFNEN